MDVAKLEMLNAKNSTGGTSSRLMNKLNANKIKELKEKILKKTEESKEVYIERPIDELVSFINGEDAAKDIKDTKQNKKNKKKKKNKNKKNNEAMIIEESSTCEDHVTIEEDSTSKDPVTVQEDFDPAMIAATDRLVVHCFDFL
ncbi:hypothetical protein P8452_55252 [Trifolium repens]|nr:hypothetical protein P8452_55252 [Trifolium repens]